MPIVSRNAQPPQGGCSFGHIHSTPANSLASFSVWTIRYFPPAHSTSAQRRVSASVNFHLCAGFLISTICTPVLGQINTPSNPARRSCGTQTHPTDRQNATRTASLASRLSPTVYRPGHDQKPPPREIHRIFTFLVCHRRSFCQSILPPKR